MRSSLFHLYRLYDIHIPENYDSELKNLVEGKMNFQFSFFHKLCKTMRDQTKKKYIFAHTFLLYHGI
ncbi:hypothetical protein GQ600_13622 [Phytophthora cactorum]|nr:hypothetical protein GQ600_13622 [Phytophthora cactorum]